MQADEYQEQLVAGQMTEQVLQTQVEQAAKVLGWRGYHTHDSRRSQAGFPDLVLVRGNRLIFAELKTQKGRVAAAQQAWLDDLTLLASWSSAAVEVYVWRPIDMVNGSLLEVLR